MPNYYKEAFLLLVLLIKLSFMDGNLNKKQQKNKKDFDFVDYISKYDPKNVMDRIQEEQKLRGQNLSDSEYLDAMIDGMDATDELLNIKVQNGDARMTIHGSARRYWTPPKGLAVYHKDLFSLRPRLFELMKQAIYQARNKMTIMQQYRAKYRDQSLYKMGFLMSKTDNACKTFSKFSYRAYKLCHLSRQKVVNRVYLYDILACEERIINLWYTVDLLVELLERNDENVRKVIEEHETGRLKMWKFED